MPDKAGHSIYLQKLGRDGDWHTVEIGTVRHDSTFEFAWAIGSPGTHTFRARITSDGVNVGSHSAPVSDHRDAASGVVAAPRFVVLAGGGVGSLRTAARPFFTPATDHSRHSPGTPRSSCSPRSSNSIPEPTTRSLTVFETKQLPGPAPRHDP